jgi:hypothetical protein
MKYEVTISRISYSTLTFGVEAKDKDEAVELALDEAYNTGWNEDSADYEVEEVGETELTDEEWEEEYGN